MNYQKIERCSYNNGDGSRVVLWVNGCTFRCKGCHNEELFPFDGGQRFTNVTLDTLISYLKDKYISGLSILGGEPLHPKNIEKVCSICNIVKKAVPNKDIWIWTGYKMEELTNIPNCDIIIDGRFEIDNPTKKKWRGSDNQRMFKNEDGHWINID